MRFLSFEIERFGRLASIDSGSESLPELVVILGQNEAGKSSLFAFLSVLLYGFKRGEGKRDLNPYSPWSGGDIEGRGRIQLSDGSEAEIHRRLLASPWAHLSRGGQVEELANHPLPWTAGVSEHVFHQLFALRHQELATLDGPGWEVVQDRLLRGFGVTDLRPVGTVLRELEEEANGLWRPDRRGKPLARQLDQTLRDLRRERAEAQARNEKIRQNLHQLEESETELGHLRRELAETTVSLEALESRSSIQKSLLRMMAMEDEVGPPELIDALVNDPLAELTRHRRGAVELEEELKQLGNRESELRRQLNQIAPDPRSLTDREQHLGSVLEARRQIALSEEKQVELISTKNRLKQRLDSACHDLFGVAADEPLVQVISSVQLGDLRDTVHRTLELRAQKERIEAAKEVRRDASLAPQHPLWLAPVTAAIGLLLVVAGVLFSMGWVIGLGVPLFVFGVGWWINIKPASGVTTEKDSLEKVRTELAATEEGLGKQFGHLRLDAQVLTTELSSIPGRVTHLRELEDEYRQITDSLSAVDSSIREQDQKISDASAELNLSPEESHEPQLRRALEAVRSDRESANRVAAELNQVTREQERCESRGSQHLVTSRKWTKTLLPFSADGTISPDADLSDPVWERAARVAEGKIATLSKIRALREELLIQNPDLDTLERRLRTHRGEVADPTEAASTAAEQTFDRDRVELRARAEEQKHRQTELIALAAKLKSEVEYLRESRTLDDVEGEILATENDREEAIHARDRKIVMAHILQTADRRFRDANQPELIRRAGEYLSAMTAGRYDRVLLAAESGKGSGGFMLEGPNYPHAIPVGPPISTGTQEQLYLALRLAAIDQIDKGGERLPLIIDELFLNWDQGRREAGLKLLASMRGTRQVFLLTCHEFIAAEVAKLGAHVIELPPPVTGADAP